ncbi:neuromedin-K receptor-like [Oculina patagonica]
MNNSSLQPTDIYNHERPCPDVVSTLFTVLLSTVSLAAFIGNILVIVSFVKTQSLRTSTNYYIVNMAVSDLFCACFNWPLYATEGMLSSKVFITEPAASVVCKLGLCFRVISQVVSLLSLVLIAVDRYVAIVFPLKMTILDQGTPRVILSLFTWIIPLFCCFPYFLYAKVVQVKNQTFCRVVWDKSAHTIFNAVGFVIFYCAPFIAMVILYTRIVKALRKRPRNNEVRRNNRRQKQHQKITKILISIVAAFFICWTPLCIYLSLKMFHPTLFVKDRCTILTGLFFYVFPSFSTAINPVILFTFSSNYRHALKTLSLHLCDIFKCRSLHLSGNRIASFQTDNVDVIELR